MTLSAQGAFCRVARTGQPTGEARLVAIGKGTPSLKKNSVPDKTINGACGRRTMGPCLIFSSRLRDELTGFVGVDSRP